MSEPTRNTTSRRDFLKNTGRLAATSVLAAGTHVAHVRGGEQHDQGRPDRLRRPRHRGGRRRPVRQERPRQARGHGRCLPEYGSRAATTTCRRRATRTGWMCRKTGGSSASTATRRRWTAWARATSRSSRTPPAFRWVHFKYAIEKGLNVFMEKPVTVDGPTTKRMFQLAEEADKKNLKVGVGLMVRHCRGRQELLKRIQDGEIGDIILLRGYRMSRPVRHRQPQARRHHRSALADQHLP